ncbi:hypothetical protein RHMOL_Rhmol01G0352300 [Rhododendron molle]|uniref:Uncharacterized protein n=1 Tax=Rhododendron molle TaxID=49168 RepID=A0ACC0QC51_RHOML|nr:hypothetical protein RHMOL_Rhmol01G0352300 [Rhododendron molle]
MGSLSDSHRGGRQTNMAFGQDNAVGFLSDSDSGDYQQREGKKSSAPGSDVSVARISIVTFITPTRKTIVGLGPAKALVEESNPQVFKANSYKGFMENYLRQALDQIRRKSGDNKWPI